jgi:hypothetical protein
MKASFISGIPMVAVIAAVQVAGFGQKPRAIRPPGV